MTSRIVVKRFRIWTNKDDNLSRTTLDLLHKQREQVWREKDLLVATFGK